MKFLSAKVHNFGSYKELHFDFESNGLTLISGPTGSGKSTLCDIIPWCLYGRTAKNGAADEIRAWDEPDATDGTLKFLVNGKSYYVRRIRGKSNDLYYGLVTDYAAEGTRGKDLSDTQKQINELVGMDAETYLMGAYFHELSQITIFFHTTAKIRRSITEQLVDLTLAKNLQEKSNAYNKELKKELEDLKQEAALQNNTLKHLTLQYQVDEEKSKEWQSEHARQLDDLISNATNYDRKWLEKLEDLYYDSNLYEQEIKDKIENLQIDIQKDTAKLKPDVYYLEAKADLMLRIVPLKLDKCSECGAAKNTDQVMLLDKQLYQLVRDEEENAKIKRRLIDLGIVFNKLDKQVNPYTKFIEQEKQRKNTYQEQIQALSKKENPYIKTQESAKDIIETQEYSIQCTQKLKDEFATEQSDLELLATTVDEFRGVIISNTVGYLQNNTNKLLNDHFDAEIRVLLTVQDADKVDVEITKDGHSCTYTQLSKGQRQLLKLCFGVSIMQSVSNYKGISFNCLWFDEALDGMDDNIKAKSFALLEALALNYDSIFVVEHSESFKSLFNNRYEVALTNGKSQIEKN